MSSSATFRAGIYQSEFARKVARWLEAMPHPPLALEISQDRVAAAILRDQEDREGSFEGVSEVHDGLLDIGPIRTNRIMCGCVPR